MPVEIDAPCTTSWWCRGETVCRIGQEGYHPGFTTDAALAGCITAANDFGCDALTECADLTEYSQRLTCALAKVDCLAGGCARTLTDCYKEPTKTAVRALYDASLACKSCVNEAFTAHTTCEDACAGTDLACLQICDARFHKALDACPTTGMGIAQLDAYLESLMDCDVTEASRTDAESGLDERDKKLCIGALLRCRKPCLSAYSSAQASVYATWAPCFQGCYDPLIAGDDTFDFGGCKNDCTMGRAAALVPSENTHYGCLKQCCQTWQKTGLDAGTSYENAWLACDNSHRTCLATCNPACDPEDEACLACPGDCNTAHNSCLAAITGAKPCLNCGFAPFTDPFAAAKALLEPSTVTAGLFNCS